MFNSAWRELAGHSLADAAVQQITLSSLSSDENQEA